MSNTSRGVMKIPTAGFASAAPITARDRRHRRRAVRDDRDDDRRVQMDLLDAQRTVIIASERRRAQPAARSRCRSRAGCQVRGAGARVQVRSRSWRSPALCDIRRCVCVLSPPPRWSWRLRAAAALSGDLLVGSPTPPRSKSGDCPAADLDALAGATLDHASWQEIFRVERRRQPAERDGGRLPRRTARVRFTPMYRFRCGPRLRAPRSTPSKIPGADPSEPWRPGRRAAGLGVRRPRAGSATTVVGRSTRAARHCPRTCCASTSSSRRRWDAGVRSSTSGW